MTLRFLQINLGYEGYRRIALGDLANARLLSRALEASGYYHVLSEIHKGPDGKDVAADNFDDVEAYAAGLPVVAFRFSDSVKQKHPNLQQVIKSSRRFLRWV